MTNKTFLTLAFSTVGERLQGLLPLLKRLSGADVEILVVVQCWGQEQKSQQPEFGKWFWSDTVGLSRSRNIALENASGEFVWLLDDDVEIKFEDLSALQNLLRQIEEPIVRVRVGCLENRTDLYKPYSKSEAFSPLMVLKMNSIELLLRRSWMLDRNISFNNNIGLGTRFPGAEEVHFLLDAVEQGASIKLVSSPYVYHSCCEGGRRKIQSVEMMEIRGATASRFGIVGTALLLRWALRYFLEYRSLSMLKALFRGFFNGYRHYC